VCSLNQLTHLIGCR